MFERAIVAAEVNGAEVVRKKSVKSSPHNVSGFRRCLLAHHTDH
jgi:hypothetical protein